MDKKLPCLIVGTYRRKYKMKHHLSTDTDWLENLYNPRLSCLAKKDLSVVAICPKLAWLPMSEWFKMRESWKICSHNIGYIQAQIPTHEYLIFYKQIGHLLARPALMMPSLTKKLIVFRLSKGHFHSDKLAESRKPRGNRQDHLLSGSASVGKWFVKDLRNVIGSAGADTPEPSIAHQNVGPNLNLFDQGRLRPRGTTVLRYLSPPVAASGTDRWGLPRDLERDCSTHCCAKGRALFFPVGCDEKWTPPLNIWNKKTKTG